MPVHIWIAWILLGIAVVLGVMLAIVKWLRHITIERYLEEFHKEFGPLAAEARAEKEKKE